MGFLIIKNFYNSISAGKTLHKLQCHSALIYHKFPNFYVFHRNCSPELSDICHSLEGALKMFVVFFLSFLFTLAFRNHLGNILQLAAVGDQELSELRQKSSVFSSTPDFLLNSSPLQGYINLRSRFLPTWRIPAVTEVFCSQLEFLSDVKHVNSFSIAFSLFAWSTLAVFAYRSSTGPRRRPSLDFSIHTCKFSAPKLISFLISTIPWGSWNGRIRPDHRLNTRKEWTNAHTVYPCWGLHQQHESSAF